MSHAKERDLAAHKAAVTGTGVCKKQSLDNTAQGDRHPKPT